jgi:transketolase
MVYPSDEQQLAHCIRVLAIDASEEAKSGHPGMPLGMADVATVLFAEFLKFIPQDPKWPNRDRLILSAGHGSLLLYSLLYLTGYEDISLEDIKQFRQLHSKTAGHPEYGLLFGIETTTGPLGQGLANAVGMLLARNLHNNSMLNHKVYAIVGDGCLMEGISHEACSFAGHLGLRDLIVLYDSNEITIDGKRGLADSEDTASRFTAYGWHTQVIDGHSYAEIRQALSVAQNNERPSLIVCRTKIAYGAPTKAGLCSAHGAPLGSLEAELTKESYGWSSDKSFFIPKELLEIWRNAVGQRSLQEYLAWRNAAEKLSADQKEVLKSIDHRTILNEHQLRTTISRLKSQYAEAKPEATRESSGKTLNELIKFVPLIGGSADLTESNYTKAVGMLTVSADNFAGNYIHYGVREHAMGAIMNGIALYGGFIPYGGSFLVFMDYAKPALRMGALMGLQVIYVMTHDSIGVGEDGPTHQPVEHLSYLRSLPNVKVFRPADGIETVECWELALREQTNPSVLVLTRQKVPQVRASGQVENLCAKGAYIIAEYEGTLKITILATGSEVALALDAQKQLQELGIGTRVISMPCFELFNQQDEVYQDSLLNNKSIKIAVEAGLRFGWDQYIGTNGLFVGMTGFGASAPGPDLFNFFAITSENVVKFALQAWNKKSKV